MYRVSAPLLSYNSINFSNLIKYKINPSRVLHLTTMYSNLNQNEKYQISLSGIAYFMSEFWFESGLTYPKFESLTCVPFFTWNNYAFHLNLFASAFRMGKAIAWQLKITFTYLSILCDNNFSKRHDTMPSLVHTVAHLWQEKISLSKDRHIKCNRSMRF